METKKNYLIQSNYFTQSVLRGVTEVQKDIIYYLQSLIDFRDNNPSDTIVFNYEKFLKYKNVNKNSFYSIAELLEICIGLRSINGVFYNKQSKSTVFFNIIDNVEVNDENGNEFIITLAKWGKIFFFEKYALAYANKTKVEYTQIESSIIDLSGERRKKFFEILSQYKSTGFLKISVEQLKILLGFILYNNEKDNSPQSAQLQLKFLFEPNDIADDYKKAEYLKVWSEFKRVFLDPAITEFNSNEKLDIGGISYTTIRLGRKITHLHFTFQKRFNVNNLSSIHQSTLNNFLSYGLNESQIMFLLQRIGSENMYNRFNKAVTFNNQYDNKESNFYRQKIWFDNETKAPIKNLGGFLYQKVFADILSNLT